MLFRVLFAGFCVFVTSHLSAQNPNGLRFDGVDDYVQTTYDGLSGTAPRTVEAWVRTSANANPNNEGIQQIITDWGTFVTGGRFTFNILWNDAIRLEVGGNGVSGTIPINDNVWHHVAAVYNPDAANEIALYVDGELDTQGNLTVALNTVTGVDLRIGRRIDNERDFLGLIDEVRVFDYARTQNEIQATMNSELCGEVDGLVAYYTFNHGEAGQDNTGVTTLVDFSGNDNDGTLQNFLLQTSVSNWMMGAPIDAVTNFSSTEVDSCDPYIWNVTGETFEESGTYTAEFENQFGCDSIIELDLTIHEPAFSFQQASACESFYWEELEMELVESGDYSVIYESNAGCDSTVTLTLDIGKPYALVIDAISCGPFMWEDSLLTEPGTYVDSLLTIQGCDSIIYLGLEIENLDAQIIDGGQGSLLAEPANAMMYQWIDCDDESAIDGETDQSFTPESTGTYAVIVETMFCSDTSDCVFFTVVDIEERSFNFGLSPNPSDGSFQIDSDKPIDHWVIRNASGQIVQQQEINIRGKHWIHSDSPSGYYLIEVVSGPVIVRKPLIIERQ